jgi:hypothetical protein
MKTIKKITVAAFILASLIGYANEDKKTTNNKAKKTVKLVFNNVKKGQILNSTIIKLKILETILKYLIFLH